MTLSATPPEACPGDPGAPSLFDAPCAPADPPCPPPFARHPLLHRWLVEYNPFYLASAALVLGGIWLLSREAARAASLWGALAVGALAELYALAAIGGAAFLVRIGQRRSAVMLGLLAVAYQGDLTLHNETCSYLGWLGVAASVGWLALCVLKLLALAWALELRPSRSAVAVPLLGAAGLALLPHTLHAVSVDVRSPLVCTWLFALFAGALWTRRELASAVPFDPRGRRAVLGTWALWGALVLAHVGYWMPSYHVSVLPLVPALPLLGVAFAREEARVWALSATALVLGALFAPAQLWWVALATASTLAVGAARQTLWRRAPDEPMTAKHPYRTAAGFDGGPLGWTGNAALGGTPNAGPRPVPQFFQDTDARLRLAAGALGAAYLALWIPDASGLGSLAHGTHTLPAQPLLGLFGLATIAAVTAWHARRPGLLGPLPPLIAHALVQHALLPLPESPLEWGVAYTCAGFLVLFGALAGSWYVGREPQPPSAATSMAAS
ncbi:MAG: hypothetical protein KC593_19565 [Myxococcales bacterium]|nr:hypothetical protein [Myxococcales bacterium]MCB9625980.1 hypothetical protein [Sandaracinaceae bacterium]